MTNENKKINNEDNIEEMAYDPPDIFTASPSEVDRGTDWFEPGGGSGNLNDAESAYGDVEWRKKGDSSWEYEYGDSIDSLDDWWIEISDLDPGETYEYRGSSEWEDPDGDWHFEHGETEEVTLDSAPFEEPSISTLSPTSSYVDKGYDYIDVGGELDDKGDADNVYGDLEYRKKGDSSWEDELGDEVQEGDHWTIEVDDLEEDTTYEYRAKSEYEGDENGDVYGDIEEITTDTKTLPDVTTENETNVDDNSATLNGDLDSLGDYDTVLVDFSYAESGESMSSVGLEEERTTTGSFDYDLTGLDPGTEYEFRALVYDETGDELLATGDDISFTTDLQDPSVETDPVTDVSEDDAKLHGDLTSMGDYDEVILAFLLEEVDTEDSDQWSVENTTTTTEYDDWASESDLTIDPETEYRYAATVFDTDGNVLTTGSWENFTTDSDVEDPEIGTPPAINVEDNTVTLVGYLDDLGSYDSIYGRFHLEEVDSSWDWYSDYHEMDSAPDTLSINTDEVDPDTEYDYNFRAYDMDENHLVTGPTENFTTKSEILTVKATTKSATNITDSGATLNGSIDDMGEYSELYYRYYIKNLDNSEVHRTPILGPESSSGDLPGTDVNLSSDTEYEYKLRIIDN